MLSSFRRGLALRPSDCHRESMRRRRRPDGLQPSGAGFTAERKAVRDGIAGRVSRRKVRRQAVSCGDDRGAD
jgi:hypothetical protein